MSEKITHYVSMGSARAIALIAGVVDTIPLWDLPSEKLIGERVAVFSAGYLAGEAIAMDVDLLRLKALDLSKAGRVGSVELVGWLQLESCLTKRRISSHQWPIGRKSPIGCATVHWLVKSPKVELNSSIVGLKRIGMAYSERPEVLERDRLFEERFGKRKKCLEARSI